MTTHRASTCLWTVRRNSKPTWWVTQWKWAGFRGLEQGGAMGTGFSLDVTSANSIIGQTLLCQKMKRGGTCAIYWSASGVGTTV